MTQPFDKHPALELLPPRAPVSTEPVPPRDPPQPGLRLSWLDKQAGGALVDGDATELHKLVTDSASALAGPDKVGAHLRLVSRELAREKANVDLLVAMLGPRAAKRDTAGFNLVDRALNGAHRRMMALLQEHRLCCATERRGTLIAVGHAERVVVKSEK